MEEINLFDNDLARFKTYAIDKKPSLGISYNSLIIVSDEKWEGIGHGMGWYGAEIIKHPFLHAYCKLDDYTDSNWIILEEPLLIPDISIMSALRSDSKVYKAINVRDVITQIIENAL